jgi:outer membrane receptor protein involved in Fe transport
MNKEDGYMKRMPVFLTLLFLLLLPALVFSQTTGKVAGIIIDDNTKEPLAGANIYLEQTSLGAAVDVDGSFFIINVPPGNYMLVVEMLGYETLKIENLRVSVNRTTTVEGKMKQAIMEGDVIVVQADRVEARKDQTGSIQTVSSDVLEALPVENISQVVAMQAGVVNGHFRGGRSNEVSYLVDGMQVDEVFGGGGRTVDLETETVEDLEVLTGTFNAEYGRAMSGVVNAVTKDGGIDFEGSVSFGGAAYPTSHNNIFFGLDKGDYIRNKDYKINLSGPIWRDKVTFFTNYRYQDNLNHLSGIRRYNVDDYSNYESEEPALWFTEDYGDSSYVSMNGSRNTSFLGKLSFKFTNHIRASLLYTYNDDNWEGYSHSFKYNPDGLASAYRTTDMVTFSLNHALSNKAFYEVKLSRVDNYNGSYLYKDPQDSRYVHDAYLRSGEDVGFVTGGQNKGHSEQTMIDLNAKFDINWQINNNHSLKTGFLYTTHDLENHYSDIRNLYYGTDFEGYVELDSTGKVVFPFYEPVTLPDSSRYSDIYNVKPYEFSAYMQDKMEFDEMVINFGLRFDYFNPNTVYPTNRRNPANKLEFADSLNRNSTYPEADAQYQISPRLGMAYQLGQRAVLHFSYGHFFQTPPMYAMYQNHSYWLGADDFAVTMGNPNLKAQKTVQYEIGLSQELIENLNLGVSLFYRDIYDLLSTKIISTYNQVEYGLYTNKDYGNAKGLEIKGEFRQGAVASYLNYTLQYTRGNADNPVQNFDRAGANADPVNKLIPMSWDQRHTLNLTLGYYKENYGVTATGYYNSGTPYTWSPLSSSPLALINISPNNDYIPSKISVDLAAYYHLKIWQDMQLSFDLSVYNLLDELNEEWVNGRTGRAYSDIIEDSDLDRHRQDFNDYEDRVHNPAMYSAPRQVKLTMGIEF